jgi:hypothetical protein
MIATESIAAVEGEFFMECNHFSDRFESPTKVSPSVATTQFMGREYIIKSTPCHKETNISPTSIQPRRQTCSSGSPGYYQMIREELEQARIESLQNAAKYSQSKKAKSRIVTGAPSQRQPQKRKSSLLNVTSSVVVVLGAIALYGWFTHPFDLANATNRKPSNASTHSVQTVK